MDRTVALGAGGLTAATIAGGLALAVVIDHFGWLGVARSPVTATKVFGIALLAFGTWLVVRDQGRLQGAKFTGGVSSRVRTVL